MNPHRRFVDIGPHYAREARAFGQELVAYYASPEGQRSASRSRTGNWGAELDPIRLGQSKAGEYAVAILFGLNPELAVKRNVGHADQGTDVRCSPTLRADVKTTPDGKLYVIWSKEVNDLYWQKTFDVLISVSIDNIDWSRCWVEGWVSKKTFFDKHLVADGTNDEGRLTPGTWFARKDVFADIEILLRSVRQGPRFGGFCHCGAPGMDMMYEGFVKTGKPIWFCNDHRPDFRALRMAYFDQHGRWPPVG